MSARSERACELRGLLVDMRTDVKAIDRFFRAADHAKVASLDRGSDDMIVLAREWLRFSTATRRVPTTGIGAFFSA